MSSDSTDECDVTEGLYEDLQLSQILNLLTFNRVTYVRCWREYL